MKFKVLPAGSASPIDKANCAYLITDSWDDWFEFSTMYTLVYINSNNEKNVIGSTKIGQFNMTRGQSRPSIPEDFEKLDENFFSVGQDDSFYEVLNDLGGILEMKYYHLLMTLLSMKISMKKQLMNE